MQLVAYGAQDIYLTGNPQITFFKVVYRRHTNFSMESIVQTFSGNENFGGEVVATISRNGDLVGRMYLEHRAKFTTVTTNDSHQIGLSEHYGHSLIKECEIEIGGQRIDKHTSMWNRVYSDLTEFNPSGHFGASVPPGTTDPTGNGTLYQLMTGNGYGLNTAINGANVEFGVCSADGTTESCNGFEYHNGSDGGGEVDTAAYIDTGKIFLPLNFWFCRNPGLALPLIALQYHEVKVKMTFEALANLGYLSPAGDDTFDTNTVVMSEGGGANEVVISDDSFNLWCDYIYLDTDERRRFAQVSHEYLIEQLQYSESTISTQSPSIDLNFNHPVKELVWTMRNESDGATGGRCQTFSNGGNGDPTASPASIDPMGGNFQLKLNGHDRFKERDSKYFTRTQVWQHHTGYGGVPTSAVHNGDLDVDTAVSNWGVDSIAVYSFALKPEEHQPSGTCNFSRIDNAQLVGTSLTTIKLTDTDGLVNEALSGGNADVVKLTIFAVNYNVLRIMSGMGGLAYSN